MAFNPFESMRKRGKTILSVVTICIMFIFVLSSGLAGGDFFNDYLPRVFGGSRATGNAVAEGFGRKITGAEISQTQSQRRAANQYMMMGAVAADTSLIRSVDLRMDKLAEETRQLLKEAVDSRRMAMDGGKDASAAERDAAARRYDGLLNQEIQFVQQFGPSAAFLRYSMRLNQLDAEKNRDEREAIATVMNVMRRDLQRRRQRMFFEWPNDSESDAIDFILMKRKAEKEGIDFPKEALDTLIANDLGGSLSATESSIIERTLRSDPRFQGLRSKDLVQAINDEYRVRTVLTSIFPGRDVGTPYDFFDYFSDSTSVATFAMVEVPVKNFVDQVKEQPTPDELKKLYDKYRTFEFNPLSETPGFKESRKIKLEYMAVDATAKLYSQSGPVLKAVAALGAGLLPGGGPAEAIMGISGPLVAENEQMRSEIDQIRKLERDFLGWGEYSSDRLHDSSIYQPLPIASMAGLLMNPFNPVREIAAAAGFAQMAHTIETRDRVKVGLAWALAGFAGPIKPYFPALVTGAAMLPPEAPDAIYAGPIRKRLAEQSVAQLFLKDMKTFLDKMNTFAVNITPKTDPAKMKQAREDAVKYIIEFASSRGIKLGASTEPRDRFSINADPGLKALEDKEPKKPGQLTGFERKFFAKFDPNSRQWSLVKENEATLFRPDWYPFEPGADEVGKPNFIAWVTEDLPSKAYLNYDLAPAAVKAKVLDAWKFAKARDIAKKAADDLGSKARDLAKKELRGPNSNVAFEDSLQNLAKSLNLPYKGRVELSRRKFQPGTGGNDIAGSYVENFRIPTDKVEFPGQMPNAMLDNRNKPLGETLILPDQPVSAYYVATLDAKQEKKVPDFSGIYRRSFVQAGAGDPFFGQEYSPKLQNEVFLETRARLHAEANYKIDPKQQENLKRTPDSDLE